MEARNTLEPVANYHGTDGYTPLVPSVTHSYTPLSRASSTKSSSPSSASSSASSSSASASSSPTLSSTDRGLQGMVDSQNFTSGSAIGLAIGLPVGVFCLGLALFLGLSIMRQKLSIKRKKSTDSATLASKESDQGWFSRAMYGNKNEYGPEYTFEKSLPLADSSTIQYRVSKSKPQHILTPKASKLRDEFTSLEGRSLNDDVDTLLYSSPPNIYHIQSEMPSTNNLSGEKRGLSSESPNKRPKPADLELPLHKWRYESPLSSWFLRNSTYLAGDEVDNHPNNVADADTILTPTVQLKQLKILSRINKDYANGSQLMENERSPIIEKSERNSQDEIGSATNETGLSAIAPRTPRLSSVSYGTTMSNTKNNNPFRDPYQINEEDRKDRRDSLLRLQLQDIDGKKPLPVTPGKDLRSDFSESIHVGHVYKVVQGYKAVLADEIDIQIGEFVLILATHTDGWCLAEKCTEDGTSKTYLKTGDTGANVNDKSYLNSERGIIPGDCLDDV